MRFIALLIAGSMTMIVGSISWAQVLEQEERASVAIRFETDIEDTGVEPPVRERGRVILGPNAVRVDGEVDESGSPSSSMIFRREKQGYLILFHETEEAVVYDLPEIEEYVEKNEVLQDRLWKRLTAGRSPEETEALMKMRESRKETARLGQDAMLAGLKLVKTEEKGESDGHPWTKFQEFRSGTLAREFLVTPWEHLGVSAETAAVFQETGQFAAQRLEISQGLDRAPDPFQHYAEFGGFPLVVRQFDGEGNVVYKSTVTSIEKVENCATLFENPGYQEEGLSDRVRVIGGDESE